MYRICYPVSILLLCIGSAPFGVYSMEKSECPSPLECLVSVAESSYKRKEREGVYVGGKRKRLYHSCYIVPCPSVFSTEQALQNHVLASHLRLLLECPLLCKGRRGYFSWPSRYKKHILTKHRRVANELLSQRVLVKACDPNYVLDREVVKLYNQHANGECLLDVPEENEAESGSPEIVLSYPQSMQEG